MKLQELKMFGITKNHLKLLDIPINAETDYQPVEILKIALETIKSYQHIAKSDDDDLDKMEIQMKRERLLASQIANQAKLMRLIPKVEAQKRMFDFIRGYRKLIEQFITKVAKKYTQGNIRDIEIYITDLYNQTLADETKVVEWEVFGEKKLLTTRLLDDSFSFEDEELEDDSI